MNKQEILAMLEDHNIAYTAYEHEPAYTIEDIDSFHLPDAQYIVKNLFLRDDKKRNYYLLIVKKDKSVNLKELRTKLQSRPLSFASENDLEKYLGLVKGSVTPFGILNDTECKVQVVFDTEVTAFPLIGIHPNINSCTVFLKTDDLIHIIKSHGNTCSAAEI